MDLRRSFQEKNEAVPPSFTVATYNVLADSYIDYEKDYADVDKLWIHRIDWERYGMPWRHRFKVRNFYNGLFELTS